MMIRVSVTIEATHCWPEAEGIRGYLANPHIHKFRVTVWARVDHADRDIEFHDLKLRLYETLWSQAQKRGFGDKAICDFGRMSCEDLCNHVLAEMPEVDKVEVMEDEDCGAEVTRGDIGLIRPPIVTICGSTRFKEAHLEAMKMLEDEGYAVFMVGCFMHADGVPVTPEQKVAYDLLHRQKVEMSDWIYVLNVDGYIGESTANEIRHARRHGVGVRFLEPDKVPSEFLG